jgi:outer membrane protein insertion porin family
LLLLLTWAVLPLAAQTTGNFTLVKLNVIGSNRYKVSEIVAASGLKTPQAITPDQLKQAAGLLGGLGLFSQVRYRYRTENTAMTAEFSVEDAPSLFPCTFGNFVWFTPEELSEGLKRRLPLFQGAVPLTGTMLDLISQQLVAMLAARGISAQVEYSSVAPLGGPVESMVFREVGVRLPVQKVDFTGVSKVDPALLQRAARPLLDQDYDSSFIRAFSQNSIASVYRQRGYLRAEFGEPEPRFAAISSASNAVAVSVPVAEGEQYRLKELSWSGQSVFPYAELEKKLHARVGNPIDAVELEQDILLLVLFYHPEGYLTAELTPHVTLDDANYTASYQIEIRQGPLFHMAKLEIAGLTDSLAQNLAQRSRLREGNPYDPTYWQNFLHEVTSMLPETQHGWTLTPKETIHGDSKTVDVRLTFAPRTHP